MSPGARLAAAFVGGPLGAVLSGALVGAGVTLIGLAAGAATLRFARLGLRSGAREWVRDKTPTRSDSLLIGWGLLGVAALQLPAGLIGRAIWSSGVAPGLMAPYFISLFVGFMAMTIAASALRTADMLRRLPALLAPGEEVRAVAVRANGFARTRSLAMLAATEERLLWVERRQVRALAYADVDRFEIDGVRGELRLHLADGKVSISPVPRREMKTFGKLLSQTKARAGTGIERV